MKSLDSPDAFKIYLNHEVHSQDFISHFKPGDILEVIETNKDTYTLSVKRVYTKTKEKCPPDLCVSVAEDVGAKDRFGR